MPINTNLTYHTSTAQSSEQYLPFHFAEDPTMPPARAAALLAEWRDDQPWRHFNVDTPGRNACKRLCYQKPLDARASDPALKQRLDWLTQVCSVPCDVTATPT